VQCPVFRLAFPVGMQCCAVELLLFHSNNIFAN
jgi:hypothetical protein